MLWRVTNSFSTSTKLGNGGFGSVHKAMLPSGQMAALKVMDLPRSLQREREFHNEFNLCSNLKSLFMVLLLGFSSNRRGQKLTDGNASGNVGILVDAGEVDEEGEEEKEKNTLGQYFGLGAETRGTATDIPDPFGIIIGNPAEIPEGYEEKWMFNIHAIDTRGVVDKQGCAECRLREGFEGPKRSLYLRYTIKWVDWDKFIVPLKIYIIDVTDNSKKSDDSIGMIPEHDCQLSEFIKNHEEYDVEPCSTGNKDDNG
ncbi:hypothetical protein Fmac_004979 [Flemingia macrophylla]|uniref:Protein kinase domain-containing protein n=1 Tax=Flemingia macrophylla TaxID=520843 RepID=A0ABD1N6L9_9FABA